MLATSVLEHYLQHGWDLVLQIPLHSFGVMVLGLLIVPTILTAQQMDKQDVQIVMGQLKRQVVLVAYRTVHIIRIVLVAQLLLLLPIAVQM
jgi:hypothetical protein